MWSRTSWQTLTIKTKSGYQWPVSTSVGKLSKDLAEYVFPLKFPIPALGSWYMALFKGFGAQMHQILVM